MKTFTFLISFFIAGFSLTQTTIYDFKVEDINGETFDLATLKGKKVMIGGNNIYKTLCRKHFRELTELI